jgi:hypothetical protein
MSLRAEYSWTLEYKPSLGWSLWVTWSRSPHPVKGMILPRGLVESEDWLELCEREANRLIRAHMEKVTRILEDGPIDPDKAEEADRLANKADHDNQLEKDLE